MSFEISLIGAVHISFLITRDCGISLPVACSDVFVYRCIVQVHRLVWSLILQEARHEPVDSAARGSFECHHPTSIPVSVHHLKLLAVYKQWLYLLVVFVAKALPN